MGHIKGQPIAYLNGHNRRKQERYRVEDRGYSSPCHIWLLGRNKWGYGAESINGATRSAHVMAYERAHGPVPKGLVLDHLCRVRECVNPEHLEPVTYAENNQRGTRTVLTPEQVQKILQLLDAGCHSRKDIAKMFDVSTGTIGCIARGETWTNVYT